MVRLDPDMPDPFEIVVGTYEQYVLGYKVENIVNEYKMERTFATHSHLASVRSVASKKHYLASGGADDSVCLYDMRYRVESGKLMHHNDTVNCIEFTPEASHVFTCSNDGSIAAIRCGNWQMEKHWLKPHKGFAVNTMAIHPSGKIAISAGADGILRTWNLVKGRQAYATNLVPRLKLDAKNVTVLKWSPNGEKYLLAVNQRIDIYSVELAGIDDEIKFDSKIVCVEFLTDNLIAVGLESGEIKFYDLEKSACTIEMIAHDIRVKCIAFKDDLLVTASSSGEIKLWRYTAHKIDMLQSINCGARITCLTFAMACKSLANKKQVKVEEEKGVKEKTKFRLRQEVVIEDEDDDWEVTPIDAQRKASNKKSKKKRNLEEIEVTDIQSTKRVKSKLNTNNSAKKKRQNKWVEDSIIDESPEKKKKLIAPDSESQVSTERKKGTNSQKNEALSRKISKTAVKEKNSYKKVKNVVEVEEDEESPPMKKKRITVDQSTHLKKRKKKQ